MSSPGMRLRVTSPGLVALPWDLPLGEWDATEVPLRDVPVGPSRHLVRFVETDGRLWAIKELPERIAAREYAVLRDLETLGLPAVRAAGLVVQNDDSTPLESNALLVTRYLDRSWQYRRLFLWLRSSPSPPRRPGPSRRAGSPTRRARPGARSRARPGRATTWSGCSSGPGRAGGTPRSRSCSSPATSRFPSPPEHRSGSC